MKRTWAILLSLVLFAAVFAGCGGLSKPADAPAVDKTLLACFGKSGGEAVKALRLTEDELQQSGHSYITELEWCGMPMETELVTDYCEKGVFGYAKARGMFPDNEDTVKTMRICLEKLTQQFGEPYGYIELGAESSGKQEYDASKLDDYFAYLERVEGEGGIQFRFSLVGKNDRLSDDGDFLDCYFLKFPDAPDKLRIQFTMTWVGDRENRNALKVSAPDTLYISAQTPGPYPAQVRKYEVDWLSFDADTLLDTFMQGAPTEQEDSATGVMYRSSSEHLLVNGGVLHGGFSYGLSSPLRDSGWDERVRYVTRENHFTASDDLTAQVYGNNEMLDFASDTELSFKTPEAVQADILARFEAAGMPELELYRCEAKDAVTMNENRDVYLQYLEKLEESSEELLHRMNEPFTQDDEHYDLLYRQLLDGLPLTNMAWPRTVRDVCTETVIYARYASDGLFEVRVDGLVEPVKPLGEVGIISPEEAVQVYIDEYSKAIHFEETELTNVELNYVVVVDGKGMYARPAWMLELVTRKSGEGDMTLDSYREYSTIAVSADTGVILERETDMR